MASICVFCGSRSGSRPAFAEAAAALGQLIADRGDTLIYGGGSLGLMGTLADQVLARRGRIIGVIPKALARVELMHPRVADMRIVPDMHVRKAQMHDLADGYIALPGGFGTMEELFEVLCWGQLEFHRSPIAVLNSGGYYDGLAKLIEQMVEEQFLTDTCRQLLTTAINVNDLKDWLQRNFASGAGQEGNSRHDEDPCETF